MDLPTSDWQSGDDAMMALISGVVRVDARGCVFLRSKVSKGVPQTRLWPVWPEGFSAYRHEGEVTLYDPEGDVVAREGDVIESGGGHMPVDESVSPRGCLPATGDIAAIQGQVRVVALAVPSLEGIIEVAEARTALEEAGFMVEVEYLDCAPGGFCKQGVSEKASDFPSSLT